MDNITCNSTLEKEIEQTIDAGYWIFESPSIPASGFCLDEHWIEDEDIAPNNLLHRVKCCDRDECISAIESKVSKKYPDFDKIWLSPVAQPIFDSEEYCCNCNEVVSYNYTDEY